MPIHDGNRRPSGLFHHFHRDWSIEIARTLNRGRLPKGLSALVEQRAGPLESEVLAIERKSKPSRHGTGKVAILQRPATRIVRNPSLSSFLQERMS